MVPPVISPNLDSVHRSEVIISTVVYCVLVYLLLKTVLPALGREIFTLYLFLIYLFNSIIPNLSLQMAKIFTCYFQLA